MTVRIPPGASCYLCIAEEIIPAHAAQPSGICLQHELRSRLTGRPVTEAEAWTAARELADEQRASISLPDRACIAYLSKSRATLVLEVISENPADLFTIADVDAAIQGVQAGRADRRAA